MKMKSSKVQKKNSWMFWLVTFLIGTQVVFLFIVVVTSVLYFAGSVLFDSIKSSTNSGGIQVYETGDIVNIKGLKVQIEEFRRPVESEVYDTEVAGGDLVVLKVRAENVSDKIMYLRTFNMSITDGSGRMYLNSYDVLGNNCFSGNDIPVGSYEEGFVSFVVDGAESEFIFHYNGYVDSEFSRGDIVFDVDIGSAGDLVIVPPVGDVLEEIEEDEYSYEISGIDETVLENGNIKYESDALQFSVILPEDAYITSYQEDNCISIDNGFVIGHNGTGGFYQYCFMTGFGEIDALESSIESMDINGKKYSVKVEKLISENESLVPESAVVLEDSDAMAFFYIVLRGDEDDPFGEDYLAIEYYDTWRSWTREKDDIKVWLSTVVVD